MRRRGRSLEDDRARITGTGFTGFVGTGFAPPGPCGRARGRAGGRILVTVMLTSRLLVVTEMSRARWPSSPTSRSCGCLHRGSNAQAVSKTGEAARLQVPMAIASGVAPRGGRGVHGVGQARERTSRARGLVRVRVQHAHRPGARSGRADRSCAACVAAGRAGGHTCGGLVSLGSEEVGDDVDRGMDHLARILVPRRVHCDVCAWRAVCVRSGVCCGWAIVLISHGGGAKRAGLERRSHLELKRRLHLELKGAELRFVERRRQGDDEW